MAVLVPAIHALGPTKSKTWMPGTRPRHNEEEIRRAQRSGDVGALLLSVGRERIEIDKTRIVSGNLGLGCAIAMHMHQCLHAPRVHVVDMLMP